jgi:signal transduction histidine kinase
MSSSALHDTNNAEELFSSVLLLEDEAAHVHLIQRALKSYVSGQIHTVGTVKEALDFIKNSSTEIDCIISDLNVPDGKEMTVVEPLINSVPSTVPIVVLTSSTSLSTAIEAMKRGARDYIVKNFGPDFKDTLGLALQRVSIASKAQKERARLEREMAILRLAIENGNDGVAIVTSNGNVKYSNQAFKEYVASIKGDESFNINQIFSENVVGAESLSKQLTAILDGTKQASFWSVEIPTVKPIGITLKLELSRIDEKHTWALWLRDISSAKKRERFQREMLSTTTHDLKGPLGAILLSSEMISSKDELPDRVKDLAVRIGASAQGAVNIIDEFLSARRIEEGTFVMRPKNYPLHITFSALTSQYESLLKPKNLNLQINCPSDLQAKYDELGILRVLGNLLTNAIKFSPKSALIIISAEKISDEEYSIFVKDNGQGMEPQEVSKLFEKFSRLDKHANIEGTGLGLYVVKSIVDAHGGRISVTSAISVGTTFEITLPITPPTNPNGELFVLDFD